MATYGSSLRRGLPRTPGGEPWPSAGDASVDTGARASAPSVERGIAVRSGDETPQQSSQTSPVVSSQPPAASSLNEQRMGPFGDGPVLRRGLPRAPGAEPWPPAGAVAKVAPLTAVETTPAVEPSLAELTSPAAASAPSPGAVPGETSTALQPGPRGPLSFRRTVTPGRYAFERPAPAPAPRRIGPFTRAQWLGATVVAGFGLLYAAVMAVLAVRWLLSTEPLEAFLAAFPGEYHLPEGAPVGIPPWLAWQHFFNVFLMLLIIRTGIRVRTDQRHSAYWTGRGKGSKKISLNLWFHQSLDILWLANGVVFIVLLFMTGQWMRVIPTSWDVFPNALSAGLQYVSLDWPTENGWVNYNSLQQLAYFTTIFIAAPLAAITGYRMSELWPHKAKTLNRIYPVEWARALHFPVMLYFVVFIFVHVALVLSTGALRNLNHMYAAQGSVDPAAYAENWTGFWTFLASLVVIAAAWVAARPTVLAPIARIFGTVSAR